MLRRGILPGHIFRDAALLIPDGIGVVMAMRWLYGCDAVRVPGSELMPRLCDAASRNGYRVYVYGAREEVNRDAVERLRERYPGIDIVGRCNGYVSDTEAVIDDINRSGADVLFVALGSPMQERWLSENAGKLKVKVCQGIGGTLDTIVGTVNRAPRFWCKCNLEWFYRLLCDPRRIRRQWVLPLFALMVMAEKIIGRQ